MKSYCKEIDITDYKFLRKSIVEYATTRKKKKQRLETASILAKYSGQNKDNILQDIRQRNMMAITIAAMCLATCLRQEIIDRRIRVPPIKYRKRIDNGSGKLRLLGIQHIKHKIYDFLAAKALMPLFLAKIGFTQYASIPGRGQVAGKRKIERWLRSDRLKIRYAAQGDIKKCYESIPIERVKETLKKAVKNETLMYLVNALLDTFRKGLSIGSYLSQWLCNLYLASAWHYVKENLYKLRKKKNGKIERVPLVKKVLFYMDDFILFGTRKADIKRAMLLLIKYIEERLNLTVKPNWKLYHTDYIDHGAHRGQPVDMMGYVMYKDHTLIRARIFLKAQKAFLRAKYELRVLDHILLRTARKAASYWGWFKNSNTKGYIIRHHIELLMKKVREVISHEGKMQIQRKTAFGKNLCAA